MSSEPDEFETAVAAHSDLFHTMGRQLRHWDETSEVIEMLLGMCTQRRLITRTGVSFAQNGAAVLLECGPRHIELGRVGRRCAVALANTAAGEGVTLRLCGVVPGRDGWVVSVMSQCDTPLPHRLTEINCGAITIAYPDER